MLHVLLKYGLVITGIRNEKGDNLLHQFINCLKEDDHDAVEICEIIMNSEISNTLTHSIDKYGWTPILRSVKLKHVQLISFFIKKGADVNFKVTSNSRFIHRRSNHSDFSIRLNGWTALHLACYRHHEEIIVFLLSKGADISVQSNTGETALSLSMLGAKNSKQCMKIVIKEIAKLPLRNTSIPITDMNFIQKNSHAREYFKKCTLELEKMANTKFYPPYSYQYVLKISKNMKKLASLTINEEFIKQFKAGLDAFPCYKDDLQRNLDEASQVRTELETIQNRLHSVFGKLLPTVVTKKMTRYCRDEELPFEWLDIYIVQYFLKCS